MSDLSLRFYLTLFLRRLPLFLFLWMSVTAAAVGIAYVLPPVYVSEAVILVERPRIPESLAASTVNVTSDEVIQIIQQRLMTSENLADIARRLEVFADQPELSERDQVRLMEDSTSFYALVTARFWPRNTPSTVTFGISFRSGDPELSARVAGELADLVLVQNREFRTEFVDETARFFRGEVERLSSELATLERDIVAFKSTNADVLPDSMDFRRQETSRIQSRLIELDAQEIALREQRAQIERALQDPLASSAVSGRELTEDERDFIQLKRQLALRSAVLSDTHPEIMALKSEIDVLASIVRGAEPTDGVDTERPAQQSQLDINLAQIDKNLEFLETQRQTLEARLADLRASIDATPDIEMSLNVMTRQYDALQAQYDGALLALNTAVQGQSIEVDQQAEHFELLEPARPPIDPESPNRLLIVAGGIVGGLVTGVAVLVLLELMNATVRRPVELVKGMGIQPFATIPYIRTQHEITRARMRMMTVLSFLLVGLPVLTYVVHTNVMPLEELFDRVIVRFGLADDTGATG